jgi:hypothetical protein
MWNTVSIGSGIEFSDLDWRLYWTWYAWEAVARSPM